MTTGDIYFLSKYSIEDKDLILKSIEHARQRVEKFALDGKEKDNTLVKLEEALLWAGQCIRVEKCKKFIKEYDKNKGEEQC
jgi:hypothetical protein